MKGRLLRMLVPLKEEGKEEVREEMTPLHIHVYIVQEDRTGLNEC